MAEKKIDGIIFDLDGTLWDSTETIVKPWNEVFSEEGIDKVLTKKDLMSVMGWVIEDIAELFVPGLDRQKQAELMKKCCAREAVYLNRDGGALYEGLEEVLSELSQKYRLFIVSNCENGYIDAFFNAHGLGKYFEDVEYTGRTGKLKGDNIKILCERSKLKNPVYVGDTQKDKEACEYARIPFIYASYGFGDVKEYDAEIEKITELKKEVEKLCIWE